MRVLLKLSLLYVNDWIISDKIRKKLPVLYFQGNYNIKIFFDVIHGFNLLELEQSEKSIL